MKNYFESDEILGMLWNWRKQLLIVFLASAIGASIFSSEVFIQPKFKSFVRVYPSNLTKYSEESPSEQMMQLLESDMIREVLIEEFNLIDHYELEPDNPHLKDYLYKEYADNFQFKKTKYESVEIEVMDVDPKLAYQMSKRLIEVYNEEVKRLQDAQLVEAVKTLKEMVVTTKIEIDTLVSKINFLRSEYGILDYGSQVRNLSKEYYRLLARSNVDPSRLTKVKQELDNLKEKGAEYEKLSNRLGSVQDHYNRVKLDLDSQEKELRRKKKYANVIVNPYEADKKVYPVRWLIVAITVISSLIMALGVISFIERVKAKELL